MPGMSGYEVAKQLRAEHEFESLVITALTGYGQAEDRRRSREAGFNHHLTKPPDPDLLAALLESPQTFSDDHVAEQLGADDTGSFCGRGDCRPDPVALVSTKCVYCKLTENLPSTHRSPSAAPPTANC